MTKLIATALLSVGIAAGAMAADMPKSAAPTFADASSTPATPSAKHTSKSGKSSKKSKKSKKTTPAPTT